MLNIKLRLFEIKQQPQVFIVNLNNRVQKTIKRIEPTNNHQKLGTSLVQKRLQVSVFIKNYVEEIGKRTLALSKYFHFFQRNIL